MDLTHASFFSGVGGLDLGLERAGWRTVSFSEIDPYASAVLAERWLGVPNLGDITSLSRNLRPGRSERDDGWTRAVLWTGGFPCQDLSVAGKRRGMGTDGDRTRSGLAFAFLSLVERYRPPAVILENVPGLLSSHAGRDFGTLLGTLGKLGYGWAYRILDAQHFGVPQRRQRVFIVALDTRRGPGAERAAEVLSVGSRCQRHLAAGVEAGPGAAGGSPVGTLNARMGTGVHNGQDDHAGFLISSSPDPGRVRAPDGLAGRTHHRDGLAATLAFRKATKAHSADDWERWERTDVTDTLDAEAMGAVQATAIMGSPKRAEPSGGNESLLPLGLDSHRYRCCGNGVVSSVAEWIGYRLAEALA